LSKHVLAKFTPREKKILGLVKDKVADGIEVWIKQGIDAAMHRVNQATPIPEELLDS
jgi:peptidyl-tRNA hydrolase